MMRSGDTSHGHNIINDNTKKNNLIATQFPEPECKKEEKMATDDGQLHTSTVMTVTLEYRSLRHETR